MITFSGQPAPTQPQGAVAPDIAAIRAKYGITPPPPVAPATTTPVGATPPVSTPRPFGGNIIPKATPPSMLAGVDKTLSDIPAATGHTGLLSKGAETLASGAYNAAKGIGGLAVTTGKDVLDYANHPIDQGNKLAAFLINELKTSVTGNESETINGVAVPKPDAVGSLLQGTVGSKGLGGLAGSVPRNLAAASGGVEGMKPTSPHEMASLGLNSLLTVLTAGGGGLTEQGVKTALEKGLITPQVAAPLTKVAQSLLGKSLESGTVGAGFQASSNIGEGRPVGENVGKAFATGAAVPGIVSSVSKAVDYASGKAPSLGRQSLDDTNKAIDEGMSKGVKPGVKTNIDEYRTKSRTAVHDIVANKDKIELPNEEGIIEKGKVPQTNEQMRLAVGQGKERIFNEYDQMQKSAGGKGAEVDLVPIADELKTVTENPALKTLDKKVVEYAQGKIEDLTAQGKFDSQSAQDAIKNLNASLKAFYDNPSYDTASKAAVDALIANKLREGLDGAIANAEGAGYQDLKNTYGAYLAIEKDVNHRAQIVARSNKMPLIDFSNIASGGELLKGLLTADPVSLGKAGVMQAIKAYIKRENSPDANIAKMFKSVDKYHSANLPATQEPSTSKNTQLPKSTPTKTPDATSKNNVIVDTMNKAEKSVKDYVKEPKLGMSMQDITKHLDTEDRAIMQEFSDTVFKDGKTPGKGLQRSAQAIADAMNLSEGLGTHKALAEKFNLILDASRKDPTRNVPLDVTE